MANVFAGWTMIAGTESVERIRDAVDVIEEFADDGAPGGSTCESVVGGEFEAVGKAMLELDGKTVVTGTVVGAEKGNVWRVGGQRKAGDEFVAAILVNALLVFIGKAEAPVLEHAGRKIVFDGGAGLQSVRRMVTRIDERALAAVGATGKAGRIGRLIRNARRYGLVDDGEGVNPAILRQVVVVEADAGAENRMLRSAGSVGDAKARGKGFTVIVRDSADEWNVQRVEGGECGILRLVAAGGDEHAESGVIAQTGVNSEGRRDAPGIFGIEA